MDTWQDWARLAISTLLAVLHGLKTGLLAVLRLVFYTLHLALYPVSWLWVAVVFILTPVIHTIRFALSPLFFIVNNFPRLQPIYIYFGSAAFVGIAFGLIFTLTSSGISSLLGLYDNKPGHQKDNEDNKAKAPYARRDLSSPYNNDNEDDDMEDPDGYRRSGSPPALAGIEQQDLEALLARLDPPESDMGSMARTGWRDGPNTKRKRKSAAALRIGTILEEDDDSL